MGGCDVVKQPVKIQMQDDVKVEAPVSQEEEVQEAQPVKAGDKTEPNLLLKSLQEERERRRLLEEELQALKQSTTETDIVSDEGKILKSNISSLESEIKAIKEEKVLSELQSKFPALKDKSAEFNEFRRSYPGSNPESVAKLFLVENDLLETPPRKGLEKATGGGRVVPQSGMSPSEIKDLRETNFRKYSQLVKDGIIKV